MKQFCSGGLIRDPGGISPDVRAVFPAASRGVAVDLGVVLGPALLLIQVGTVAAVERLAIYCGERLLDYPYQRFSSLKDV